MNVGYSYFDYYANRPPCPGPLEKCVDGPPAGFIDQQHSQDLVMAITLVVIGIAVLVGHHFFFGAIQGLRGGNPIWKMRGRWIAVTAICGLVALGATAVAIYSTISYFILSGSASRQLFGEAVGLAIAFLPAWAFA